MQPGKASIKTQLLALHPVTWEKVNELEARIVNLEKVMQKLCAQVFAPAASSKRQPKGAA